MFPFVNPVVAVRDGLEMCVVNTLVTLDIDLFSSGQSFHCSVDGTSYDLIQKGVDFWLNTASKIRATNEVPWF
jgi:hypothetical protein